MTEQEERELIKSKIIEDIDFLKQNENTIRTRLITLVSDRNEIVPVDKAMNTLKMNDFSYLDTGTLDNLKNYYTNFINRLTIAARAFIQNPSIKNTQKELMESSKIFNELVITMLPIEEKNQSTSSINFDEILQKHKQLEEYFQPEIEQIKSTSFDPKNAFGLSDQEKQLNDLEKRLKALEQEQKPLNDLNIRAEQDKKEYSKKINELKQNITDLQSSDTQIEITKILTQTKALFEEAKDSKQLVNDEVQKLLQATEREVAYTLSQQFSEKTNSLKRPIWSYLLVIIALPIYLSLQDMDYVELLLKPASNEIYWHTIFMLLLTKLPIVFLIFFVLNEYTKAKKLFEEYEHKRIMAATLVNNLERLKNELHADEKDLLELIKVPFEKIFDNPVHSIYGDKSGDKNIGLDQLEKITSIIEKMKK
jgi:hypothetical protein